MRMTSTGAFPRALAAARPPKPPPTITTRGVFDVCPSAPLIELRLASFIHPFLKLRNPEISENLGFLVSHAQQAYCISEWNCVTCSATKGVTYASLTCRKIDIQLDR